MGDVIEDLVKRSILAYREGDYEPIFGAPYIAYVKATGIDEVAWEVLGNAEYLRPLRIAFERHAPLADEIYLFVMDRCAVVTNRRLFQIEGHSLLRPPIELTEIESYEQSGFWRKRETIQLIDGERIERKTGAAIDADVMQLLIDRAKAATQAGPKEVPTPARVPASAPEAAAPDVELPRRPLTLDDLRSLHGRALRRLQSDLERVESPDTWTTLSLRWVGEMIHFIDACKGSPLEQAPLPRWLHVSGISIRREGECAALEHEAEIAALRLSGEWAILGLDLPELHQQGDGTSAEKAQMALLEFIGVVTQRIGGDVSAAVREHAQDVAANMKEREQQPRESAIDAVEADPKSESRAVGLQTSDLQRLSDAALLSCQHSAMTRLLAFLEGRGRDDEWTDFMARLIETMKSWLEARAAAPRDAQTLDFADPPAFPTFDMDAGKSIAVRTASEVMIATFNLVRLHSETSHDETVEQLYLKTMLLVPFVQLEYGVEDSTLMRAYADDLDAAIAREGLRPAALTAEAPDFAALFVERMRAHRDRMLASGHPDRSEIAGRFGDDTLAGLADVAASKMAQSWNDGVPHSILLADADTATALVTFRGSVMDAADWYARVWGGYTNMLDRYLGGDEVLGTSPDAFCHISFGSDGETGWVNLSLVAVAGQAFRKVPILATDLMSSDERKDREAEDDF